MTEEDTDSTAPMTVSDSGPNRGDIPSNDDDEDNGLTSGDGNHSGDGPDTDDRYTTNKPRPIGLQDDNNIMLNGFNLTITLPPDSGITGDLTTTTTTTTTSTAATITTTTTTTTTATAATQPSTTAQPSTTTESPTSAPPLSPTQLFVDPVTSNTVIFYFYTRVSHIG